MSSGMSLDDDLALIFESLPVGVQHKLVWASREYGVSIQYIMKAVLRCVLMDCDDPNDDDLDYFGGFIEREWQYFTRSGGN